MSRAWSTMILNSIACLLISTPTASAAEPSFNRKEDVIYGRKYGTALTMDVFNPKANAKGIGVVFVVSGGFFSSHEAINPVFVRPFINRGFTVFAVVHGSQPRFTVPEIIQDMNRAVRFIRHHARDYGIDPDRIGVYGGSAGGHLSLMLGMAGDKGDPNAKDPVDRESSRVQAVACFFPPTDLLNFGKPGKEMIHATDHQPPFRAAFDYRELDKQTMIWLPITDDQRLRDITRQISPITFVTPDDPPTLIIHGDGDTLVPLQQSEVMVDKLKKTGVEVKLVVKKGAGHGWVGLDKDLPQFADWFDQHLRRTEQSRSGLSSSSRLALRFDRIVIDNHGPKNPWVKIVGDLDGDGLKDVVIGGQDGPLVWYRNPTWAKSVIAPGGYATVDGEAGDVDGDGDLDLVLGGVVWYENPKQKGDPSKTPWAAHRIGNHECHDIEIGDLDGDGDLDVVSRDQSLFGHKAGDRILIWRQENPTNWTSREIRCPHGEGLKLADIDRDGDLDILVAARWYENTGDILKGRWIEHVVSSTWTYGDAKVETGDLNGDGRLDMILTPAEGEYRITWLEAHRPKGDGMAGARYRIAL